MRKMQRILFLVVCFSLALAGLANAAGLGIHVVQPGESLSAIAAKHGVSMQDLVELNTLADPNRIRVGQEIKYAATVAAEDVVTVPGLLAYWRLDDASQLTDLTGNGHTLMVQNGADGVNAAVLEEGGLRFSGDDYAVSADSGLAQRIGNGPSTLSCWFKSDTFENAKMLCGWNQKDPAFYMFELRLHKKESALFNIQDLTQKEKNRGNNNVGGGTGLNDGKWHHVAGVREFGKTLRLYVDGDEVASTEDFGWGLPSEVLFHVGGVAPLPYKLAGDMDSVSVWSRALKAGEVKALVARGRTTEPQ